MSESRPTMNSYTFAQLVVSEGYVPSLGRARCHTEAHHDPCRGCELRATCAHTAMSCRAFRLYYSGRRYADGDRGIDLALDAPEDSSRPYTFTKPRKPRCDRGMKRGKQGKRRAA